ncbi:peroxisomal membrane protein PEX16-like [Corticium candelabrum]|uniref:peroxisomal membrane protein PEX16-like n=1 Tax=Corticium candelabrum TaxID=121492 RepID=UPI002E275C9C|nr:peroxisomal membrane protein PEX16-like [Corticium candelabrum]
MAADAFTASKVEGAIRTASYLIPGRFKAADEISELVYAAGNLLGLFNDILLKHKAKLVEVWTREQAYFMKLLTVIEYVEVFVEIASERLWGEPFKWMVVLCIHIIKSVLRYILLFKHKAGILPNPPTQPLNRERDLPNTTFTSVTSESSSSSSSGVWKAERSGKFVQSLGSSNGNERAWQRRHQPLSVTSQPPTALKLDQTAGEALYIARPLAHFPSMFVFGEKSWKPWILSLSMDLASIALLSRGKNYNYAELSELKRRKWMLLFYILRSPFYDRYSKLRILGLLGWLCRVLPWFSMFIQPIVDYLPMWQRTYFYNWAS